MGTTGCHKPKSVGKVEFLMRELFGADPDQDYVLMASHVTGEATYLAVKQVKATGHYPAGYVMGIVVKTERRQKGAEVDGWGAAYGQPINFWYKEMTEEMGPFYYEAPDSLIAKLSGTDNKNAQKWREGCREANAKARTIKEMAPYTRFRFADPLDYGKYGLISEFQKSGEGFLAMPDTGGSFACRIRKETLLTRQWTVL